MDRQISERPRAVRRHPLADARTGAGRLGDQGGDRARRRHAAHALHPRARGRDLLHAVPAEAGRHARPCAGVRHDALHAARRRGADGRLPRQRSTTTSSTPTTTARCRGRRSNALGACVNAPMVMIFKDTYEDLTPERLGEIIDAFAAGKGASVPAGPQIDRIVSAPQSGLTTLRDEKAVLKSTRDKEAEAEAAAAMAAPAATAAPAGRHAAAVQRRQAEDRRARDQRGDQIAVRGQGCAGGGSRGRARRSRTPPTRTKPRNRLKQRAKPRGWRAGRRLRKP